jgi:ATP-dependent helicase/DNAse subunit B
LLTVPAQPGRGGVELHTPKALWGANYRYVFVLGMAEGLFPAPLPDDPVLDFYTRKRLIRQGLPLEDATQAVRREALSFELLLQVATETLIFSYPQRLGKEEMLPSPYLAKSNLKPQVPEAIAVASREEARKANLAGIRALGTPVILDADDRVFDRVVRAWTVEQRRESATPYDEYDGVVEIGIDPAQHVFSASQLTQLGQCGFKWFAGYLLKLAELTEADTEFNGKLRGRLYHKTLELVVQKAQGKSDVRQGMLDALDEAFWEAEKSENLLGIPAWDARRPEHLALLRRTIAHESFISPETEILGVELKFKGQWYGLKVEGIVDRIDLTPDGLCAIEYKNLSSKPTAAKDASGKANLDVQLPLYSQVATAALFPDRPVSKAYYYSISKQKAMKADAEETELEEFADRIQQHLKQGDYPVEPDIDGKACQYCCQDLVCRQGARLSRKIKEGVQVFGNSEDELLTSVRD